MRGSRTGGHSTHSVHGSLTEVSPRIGGTVAATWLARLMPMAPRRTGSDPVTDDAPPTPVGRPRANPRPLSGSPREEIVAVATRLFGAQGFANTTMAQIAEAAGLRQSSLYYYFRRKELILEATFSVNRAPLEFLKRIASEPGPPA